MMQCLQSQRVLSTHMGNTYPNHKGRYYYRNHTLYHIGTLDPLGGSRDLGTFFAAGKCGHIISPSLDPWDFVTRNKGLGFRV